jgi:hypothetical protein
LVLDELPYLLDHSPEIPSVLQELLDEGAGGARPAGSRDRLPALPICCPAPQTRQRAGDSPSAR